MGWFTKSPPPAPAQPNTTAPATATDVLCSFCGKHQREVLKIVAGPSVFICNECVLLSQEIIEEQERSQLPKTPELATLQLKFDRSVVGQAPAVRSLIASVRQHFYRIHKTDSTMRPARVLLLGPRGTGKTTIGRVLCSATGLPSYHADVGRLSESGYVGEDVENLLSGLLETTAFSATIAQCGVLFLDGLEKLRAQRPNSPTVRDISGEGVQRELLRLLDGMTLRVPESLRRHPQATVLSFSCDRLLVAAAMTVEEKQFPADATPRQLREGLLELGMLPQLVARFDTIVRLQRLDASSMKRILTGPGGPLEQASKMVEALGGMLDYDDEAVQVITEAAAHDPDGAWAVSRVVQRFLENLLNAPNVHGRWTLRGSDARALL